MATVQVCSPVTLSRVLIIRKQQPLPCIPTLVGDMVTEGQSRRGYSQRQDRSLFHSTTIPASKIFLTTPGIRAFLVWALSFAFAIFYGHTHFYRDPGSIFFDRTRAYELSYSLWRERQALDFIQRANGVGKNEELAIPSAGYQRAGSRPALCATFMTVKRKLDRQYIETSLGSLLEGLTPVERADLHLKVLFASTEPELHPTWSQPWLRSLLDEAFTYNDTMTMEDVKHMRDLETQGQQNIFEKGTTDYMTALRRCYDTTSSPYIAVFEDDVLFADGWLVRSILGLKEIEGQIARSGQSDKWLYMRLFNQERSTGWASRKIGGNNEQWISLGLGSIVCVTIITLRRKWRLLRACIDNWALAIIIFLGIPSFVVLFFQAGKASLLPPSAGVKEEPFGCCSQGLIFSREQVPSLIDYLQLHAADRSDSFMHSALAEVGKYDMITRDYSRRTGLGRWALYPVQIQHLGVQSTIGTKESEAQAVWSMAFESLNPKSLSKTHAAMVKQYYGRIATTT